MYDSINAEIERAVLIGVITQEQKEEQVTEYLDELAFLAETAGAETAKRFTQKLEKPHPKTFVGTGKLQEIADYVNKEEIGLIIFDDELTPSQTRNIENAFQDIKVLDRSKLILDIFAKRARTAAAKTQVELAQYEYLLPRLTRMWTHLSRQKGGIGMRGPGETEIETDRRIIRDKIALLKTKLAKIDKQKATQRRGREQMIRAALVGYTNVGKSTLMNLLSKSDVFAENKLFATLDTTVRKIVVGNLPFLLTDTVGFIRKLPHHLVDSFKSTLDEVREADVLLHVVDISHPQFEDQIETVNQTLQDLKANDKPIIMIFNKVDAYTYIKKDEDDLTPETKENLSLEDLQRTYMAKENYPCIFISAQKRINYEELREMLYQHIHDLHMKIYPHRMLY
ncbi:MAG: GTPase HflX [Flavobacteriales bacterium]|nr:GTPase HflX [Flavobacteriales bacterium]